MKYFYLLLALFIFSCSGTPETIEPEEELIIEIISEEEDLPPYEGLTEDELLEHMIQIDESETQIAEEEYIDETEEFEEIAEEIEELTEESEMIEEIVEIEEPDGEEIEDVQIVEETAPEPEIEPEPAAVTEAEAEPEQVEVTEAEPEPEPVRAEQPVRRPPVPSTSLGPAEERLPPPAPSIPPSPAIRDNRSQVQENQTVIPPPIIQQPFTEDSNIVAAPRSRQDDVHEFQPIPVPDSPSLSRDEGVNISRVVRAEAGQNIEVPFRGSNWVYLGELASRRGVSYLSRRLDSEGQSFIFRAEEAGTYILRFSRHDLVRGFLINDHVQVIVSEAPAAGAAWFNQAGERSRVVAEPRWPSALEEAEIISRARDRSTANQDMFIPLEPVPSASAVTEASSLSMPESSIISESPADNAVRELPPAVPSPDVLLQRARESFDAGNTAAAISFLDQYRLNYPGLGEDELFWLYGQFYEANTPSRNILLSLDYYRRLVREYPGSVHLNDARRRIAFIERFYINIQ